MYALYLIDTPSGQTLVQRYDDGTEYRVSISADDWECTTGVIRENA